MLKTEWSAGRTSSLHRGYEQQQVDAYLGSACTSVNRYFPSINRSIEVSLYWLRFHMHHMCTSHHSKTHWNTHQLSYTTKKQYIAQLVYFDVATASLLSKYSTISSVFQFLIWTTVLAPLSSYMTSLGTTPGLMVESRFEYFLAFSLMNASINGYDLHTYYLTN